MFSELLAVRGFCKVHTIVCNQLLANLRFRLESRTVMGFFDDAHIHVQMFMFVGRLSDIIRLRFAMTDKAGAIGFRVLAFISPSPQSPPLSRLRIKLRRSWREGKSKERG